MRGPARARNLKKVLSGKVSWRRRLASMPVFVKKPNSNHQQSSFVNSAQKKTPPLKTKDLGIASYAAAETGGSL
jgi:hypothetical protein